MAFSEYMNFNIFKNIIVLVFVFCLEARSFIDEIEAEKRLLSIGKISILPYQEMLQQKTGRTLAAMLL